MPIPNPDLLHLQPQGFASQQRPAMALPASELTVQQRFGGRGLRARVIVASPRATVTSLCSANPLLALPRCSI